MAEIVPLGNGVFRVVESGRSRLAYAAGPPSARWVFLEGQVYVVDVEEPAFRAAKRKRSDDHTLAAPMPATVSKIIVQPGQRVSRGDVLIVLEAMKMEMPIKAPRDASVKSIACRQGELVQPGVPLLELA